MLPESSKHPLLVAAEEEAREKLYKEHARTARRHASIILLFALLILAAAFIYGALVWGGQA